MPAPDAKDAVKTAEAKQPSPNDVSGYYERDEEGKLDPDKWVPPVDPSGLNPDEHRAVIGYDERTDKDALSVPLAEAS